MPFGEKRKPVSFNLDNDRERKLYEFAQQINFSKLVKQFLDAELSRSTPRNAVTYNTTHSESK